MRRLVVILVMSFVSAGCARGPRVEWLTSNQTTGPVVRVRGLDPQALQRFAASNPSSSDWQRVLAVHLEGTASPGTSLPPMLGTYRADGDTLTFGPRFPLDPGANYRATFNYGALVGSSGVGPISAVFHVPTATHAQATIVSQVYPSGPVVPENLLKFYVHFSAPMRGGSIYEHIHLLDSAGKPIELPFLEIDEELWNPEMTRLTLIIDPGRIKRGVKPLEDIGPALRSGENFKLVIDGAWKDASGQPLRETYRRQYRVEPPDRAPPDPATWRVELAEKSAGSRAPLQIDFGEPMDSALAMRLIGVQDSSGKPIGGTIALQDCERRWCFTPDAPWAAGKYTIVASSTLEDLAGNNIGKPFDVDLEQSPQPLAPRTVTKLEFTVR